MAELLNNAKKELENEKSKKFNKAFLLYKNNKTREKYIFFF